MRPGKTKKVGVVHILEGQPWGLQLKEDLEAGVGEGSGNVQLQFADTLGSVEEQEKHLEAFLKAKVDALVIAPIGVDRVKVLLRKYRVARIPVIVVGDDPGDPDLYRTVIIPDNRQIGRKMGEFFVEATGGKAELVEITGIAAAGATAHRSQGFREAIAGAPGVRIVEQLVGDWRHDSAHRAFADWFSRHPPIDGVFAHNDEMARAAWEAAHELGRDKELLVTGVDAIKGQGLTWVMQGKLAATLLNPPPGRPAALALLAILAGEPVLERNVLQTSLFRSHERIRAWQEGRARRPAGASA